MKAQPSSKTRTQLSPNLQHSSKSKGVVRSTRSIKIIICIGVILEIALVSAIVWILINEGPNKAVTTLTIAATIVAILSAIPALCLAYFQWAHPKSIGERKINSQVSGKIASGALSTLHPQPSQISPTIPNSAIATTIISPATKGQQLIMASSVRHRPLLLISYNDADLMWAKWIDTQLKQDGYPTILRADFVIGTNTILEMEQALRSMRHAVTVISPDYINKSQEEWASIFRTDPIGQDLTLIPVYVRDSKAELAKGFLGGFKAIDLVGKSAEEARQLLLEEIHRSVDGNQPPRQPAPFPGKE